jgi:DNA-binding transcriptional ArsR family regulator
MYEMSDEKTLNTEQKVVPFQPKTAVKAIEKKWGHDVLRHGWCPLPSLLFRAQRKLNISALQMAVLLQILEHWWEAERAPYPSKETIAHRLDMSARQVQRHISALEKAGYVKRRERKTVDNGQLSNFYELDGLVAALKRIEPEVAQAFAESRQRIRTATARGVKPRMIQVQTRSGTKAFS